MWRWMNGVGKNKKRSVFVKFLLSYIVILLLPIAIGTNEYDKTRRVLVDDATDLNLQILTMSQDIVDRLFLEVDDVVSALSVNNDVLTLMQSVGTPLGPEEIYKFSLLRNDLNRYMITNKFFFDIDIYFKNSRSVVTSKTTFDLRDSAIRIGDRPLEDWVEQVSQRSNQKRFYNLNGVSFGTGESYNLIAYVSPLPNGVQGKVQGAVIVFIDQKDITALFHRLVVKNGGFAYIMDTQGQIIAPALAENGRVIQPIPLQFAANTGSAFKQIDGTRMLVSYSRSGQNGWTYIAALPASVVLAKADYIKRMIVDITLITLGLGVVVALLMAYRNSKPLSELMDTMKDFVAGESGGRRASVYDVLQNGVTAIIHNNRMLNTHMEEQLPLIQAALLERLLKGYYKSEQEARSALEQAKATLRGERFFVIAMRVHAEQTLTAALSNAGAGKELMMRELEEQLAGCDYLLSVSGERAEMIVSLDAANADMELARIRSGLQDREGGVGGEHGMLVAIGIGRVYGRLHEIWRSHHEACQALEYCVLGDGRGAAVWYDSIAQGASRYYYPLDLELKLIHSVKNGDMDGLDHLLQHIEEQNVAFRQLSAATMKMFVAEIQGTVHKLLEQLEYGSDTFAELNVELDFLNKPESDAHWPTLKKALRVIGAHINRNKKQKHNKMVDEMMAIVHDGYADANFSLTGLAGHFKLSESFMSLLFKEQVGENFSEYVEKLRLDRACVLLKETDKSINEIALEVGYNSDKTFRRAFKRARGIQPTSYRDSLTAQSTQFMP